MIQTVQAMFFVLVIVGDFPFEWGFLKELKYSNGFNFVLDGNNLE